MTDSVSVHKNVPHTKIKNKTKRNWRQRYLVKERKKEVHNNNTKSRKKIYIILQELLELASKFTYTVFKFHFNVT